MNIARLFSEDNGRSTRIWLDRILKNETGKVVAGSKVDKVGYLPAMDRSRIRDIVTSKYAPVMSLRHKYLRLNYSDFCIIMPHIS